MTQPWGPRRRRGGRWQGHRPPWWPETEAWPPDPITQRSRGWSPGLWRPFGCLLIAIVLFAVGMIAIAIWALAALVGLVSAPPIVTAGGLVALILVVGVLVILTRGLGRMSRPVDELIAAAERVEAGDYSTRVTESGPRPVRRLARAFNTMGARLESSDQQRRSFLADVSHELRTPLTVIQGQLEAISDGVYPADPAHLEPILQQTRLLERLIEDLRTVALAEAGSLKLATEPTDVGALATEVVAGFRVAADEARVQLTAEAAGGLPELRVDPARIRQVLSNLIDNALRHTPAGGRITITVRGDGQGVAIEVHDTGTGIPPEMLPRVFDRFAKGAGSTGSGLGLAIAKDLVEAHGGTITASSASGQGSTFRVSLPVRGPAA